VAIARYYGATATRSLTARRQSLPHGRNSHGYDASLKASGNHSRNQLMQGSACQWAVKYPPACLESHGRKGLDTGNKVLARAVAGRLIHALRQQCRRGLIDGTEKHRGARVWALPAAKGE
jgi:hypothetical protein